MPSPRPDSKFQILSLDGGGIRGAFAASFLATIEAHGKLKVSEYFDLIAGTSTGGIIALAMAFEEPAQRVLDFYIEHGPRIFVRSRLARAMRAIKSKICSPLRDVSLFRASYAPDSLRTALRDFFGDRTVGDAPRRVVLPCVDLSKGQTVVFKTPHLSGLYRDGPIPAWEVALALCAAPTFLPPHSIGQGSAYCDGGLWANNPAMIGYAEAAKIRAERIERREPPEFSVDGVSLLSIGTGAPKSYLKPPAGGGGLAFWARPLVELTGLSQSQGVHFQCRYVLTAERYERIDFDLPDRTWALDAVDKIDALVHLGRERAMETIANVKQRFLSDKRPPREGTRGSTSSLNDGVDA